MSWKENAPSLVVTVLWSMPVALSVAFTAALGTTAPDGSVTVPLIAPRNVCASAATASDKTTRIAKTRRFIISTPPLRDRTTTDSTRIPRPGRGTLQKMKLNERNLFLKMWTSPPDQLALFGSKKQYSSKANMALVLEF